jgi:hypothetical protein
VQVGKDRLHHGSVWEDFGKERTLTVCGYKKYVVQIKYLSIERVKVFQNQSPPAFQHKTRDASLFSKVNRQTNYIHYTTLSILGFVLYITRFCTPNLRNAKSPSLSLTQVNENCEKECPLAGGKGFSTNFWYGVVAGS